jgi:hypothetical protein
VRGDRDRPDRGGREEAEAEQPDGDEHTDDKGDDEGTRHVASLVVAPFGVAPPAGAGTCEAPIDYRQRV